MWTPSSKFRRRTGKAFRLLLVAFALLLSVFVALPPVHSQPNLYTSGRVAGNGSSQTCKVTPNTADVIAVLISAGATVSSVADGGDTFGSQVSSTSTGVKAYLYTAAVATGGSVKSVVVSFGSSTWSTVWCSAGPGFSKTAAHTTSGTGTMSGNGTANWSASVGSFTPASTNLVVSMAVGSVCSTYGSSTYPPIPAYPNGANLLMTSVTPTSPVACSYAGTHPVTPAANFLNVGGVSWNASSLGPATTLPYSFTGTLPIEGSHTQNPSAPWVELEADFAPSTTTTDTVARAATIAFTKWAFGGDQVSQSDALNFGQWAYRGDTIAFSDAFNWARWTYSGDAVLNSYPVSFTRYPFGGIQFFPAFNQSQLSTNSYPVGFCANSTKLSLNTCGVFVKFTPVNTGAQTVTVSSHIITPTTTCSESPSTVPGDGSQHQLTVSINCLETFTLPAGYAWQGGTSRTFTAVSFNGVITNGFYFVGGVTTTTTTTATTSATSAPAGETTIYVKGTFTGGTPGAYPLFTYSRGGSPHTILLTNSYQNVTVDVGTLWSVPSPYFSNLVNWYTYPSSGFVSSGWPYGSNYNFAYAQAPACQSTGNEWTDLLNRCYFQWFWDLYQPTIGGSSAVGLILATIDVSLYFRNKHVMIAATIMAVEAMIFVGVGGLGLPSWIGPIGWTILALSLTAIVWSLFTRRK